MIYLRLFKTKSLCRETNEIKTFYHIDRTYNFLQRFLSFLVKGFDSVGYTDRKTAIKVLNEYRKTYPNKVKILDCW